MAGETTVRSTPEPGELPPKEAHKAADKRREATRKAREEANPRQVEEEERLSSDFTSQHPLRHRDPEPKKDWQKPKEGELNLVDPEGRLWGPIACGVHRSAPSFREPDGYQPDCSACEMELASTLESNSRYATV
jgi:hypothetical protein